MPVKFDPFCSGKSKIIDPYSIMLIMYIPICLGVYSNSNNSIQENDEQLYTIHESSLEYRYILIVEMTIAGLLLVEALIDAISNTSNLLSSEGSLVNISILTSLLIGSITIFFSAIPNNNLYFIFAIIETRLILIFGAILSYSYHYGQGIWRSRYMIASAYLGGAGFVLQTSDALYNGEISSAATGLQAISTIAFVMSYLRWTRYLINERNSRKITRNEWNCTTYMAVGIITMLIEWALGAIFDINTVADCSEQFLICVEVSITAFVVIQFLYQTRVLRKEYNKHK
eukprot:gene13751-29244_t